MIMNSRFIKIGAAAELLGVSVDTLRKWEVSGELIPDRKSQGGTRFYDSSKLINLGSADSPTICYARISSHELKLDLERQQGILEAYCVSQGWKFEMIQDLGSGMNYHKSGLQKLLEKILRKQTKRLVLTHKDRLLRFGAELIFSVCEHQGIEIVVINKGEQLRFVEEELAQDLLEIITAFSARLYNSKSKKSKALLQRLQEEVNTVVRNIDNNITKIKS